MNDFSSWSFKQGDTPLLRSSSGAGATVPLCFLNHFPRPFPGLCLLGVGFIPSLSLVAVWSSFFTSSSLAGWFVFSTHSSAFPSLFPPICCCFSFDLSADPMRLALFFFLLFLPRGFSVRGCCPLSYPFSTSIMGSLMKSSFPIDERFFLNDVRSKTVS